MILSVLLAWLAGVGAGASIYRWIIRHPYRWVCPGCNFEVSGTELIEVNEMADMHSQHHKENLP